MRPQVWALVLALGATLGAAHPRMDCSSCHTPQSQPQTFSTREVWSTKLADDQKATTFDWFGAGGSLSDVRFGKSPTMDAHVGAPDGASRVCLSCHDGTDSRVSAEHVIGPGRGMGSLGASHPVSFVYDSHLAAVDGALVNPARLPVGVLDAQSKMQCTSCHDPHLSNEKNMLRWPYNDNVPSTTAAFCRNCHIK